MLRRWLSSSICGGDTSDTTGAIAAVLDDDDAREGCRWSTDRLFRFKMATYRSEATLGS